MKMLRKWFAVVSSLPQQLTYLARISGHCFCNAKKNSWNKLKVKNRISRHVLHNTISPSTAD